MTSYHCIYPYKYWAWDLFTELCYAQIISALVELTKAIFQRYRLNSVSICFCTNFELTLRINGSDSCICIKTCMTVVSAHTRDTQTFSFILTLLWLIVFLSIEVTPNQTKPLLSIGKQNTTWIESCGLNLVKQIFTPV